MKRRSLMLLTLCMSLTSCTGDDTGTFDPNTPRPGYRDGRLGDACMSDARCALPLRCDDAGVCAFAAEATQGQRCQRSGECAAGLYCEPQVGTCAPGGEAPQGAPCATTRECVAGLVCAYRGVMGVCAPGGAGDLGDVCATSGECLAGLQCARARAGEPLRCAAGLASLPAPFSGVDCQASRADAGAARFLFELPGDEPVTEFYRLPYPNNIRLREGRPDLSGHPTPGPGVLGYDLVRQLIDAAQATQDRFGTNAAILLRSSATLDYESLKGADVITLRDITPGSPTYGERHPVSWQASGGDSSDGRYICRNWLSVQPFWGRPLRANTTYALMITAEARAEGGGALAQDEDFQAMLSADRPSEGRLARGWDVYAPLRAFLSDDDARGALSAQTLAVASVFTTGEPWRLTQRLRDAARAQPVTIEALTRCDADTRSPCDDGLDGEAHTRGCFGAPVGMHELHGRLNLPIFQRGEAPYEREGGELALSAQGAPVKQRDEAVCASITVPTSPAPAQGWPVLIVAHGTGGTFRGQVDELGALVSAMPSESGARVGMITVSWDQVLHGARRGAGVTTAPEPLVYHYGNPQAAQGNFLQAAAELFAVVGFVEGLSIPAARSPTGEAIVVDPRNIYVLGHSQGATSASLAVPFEPLVRALVLSGAGGGLTLAMMGKKAPVDALLGLRVALQDPDVGAGHPVMQLLQAYFEPVDPLNYGGALGANPQSDGASQARHVFHIYGVGDSYTPPEGMKAMARALRASYLEPVLDAFTGGGIFTSPGPVSANRVEDEVRYTVVGKQYAPEGYDGHFVSARHPRARADLAQFLVSAIQQAAPSLGGP